MNDIKKVIEKLKNDTPIKYKLTTRKEPFEGTFLGTDEAGFIYIRRMGEGKFLLNPSLFESITRLD